MSQLVLVRSSKTSTQAPLGSDAEFALKGVVHEGEYVESGHAPHEYAQSAWLAAHEPSTTLARQCSAPAVSLHWHGSRGTIGAVVVEDSEFCTVVVDDGEGEPSAFAGAGRTKVVKSSFGLGVPPVVASTGTGSVIALVTTDRVVATADDGRADATSTSCGAG